MTTPSSYTTFRYILPANMQTYIYEPWSTGINLGHSQEKTLNHFPWNQSSGNGTESASAFLVCFTDPLSLSFSPQLSPCFQPLNKSYPPAAITITKGKRFPFFTGVAVLGWGGGILVLNCQMTWHIILIYRILISKRGYQSRLQHF